MATFSKQQRAFDDSFIFSEDQLLTSNSITLIVLNNDSNNKGLYSIDKGVGPRPPNSLLTADTLKKGLSAWEATADDNQMRINKDKIDFDFTHKLASLGVSNVNALTSSDIIHDTFVYAVDLSGTISWAQVDVTIQGVNDAAAMTGITSGSIGEDDVSPVTGTVVVADPDRGESHTLAVTNGATTSGFGTFSVDGDGHWSYTLNNASVQDLDFGESVVDQFTIKSIDGTAAKTISVTINGANEGTPVVPEAADFMVVGLQGGASIYRIGPDGTISNGEAFLSNGGQWNYGSVIGDFTGDGSADVFVSGDGGAGRLYFGNGDGTFIDSGTFFPGSFQRGGTAGDVDNDGDLDLFVRNGTNASIMYMNGGTGHFSDGFQYFDSSGFFQYTVGSALEDFNGDGSLDLYIRRVDDSASSPIPDKILFGDGTGNFQDSGTVLPGGFGYDAVNFGDVDGNGSIDIVRGTGGLSTPQVLLNTGSGTFVASSENLGSDFHGGLLSDVDSNGTLDIVSYSNTDDWAYWLSNDGEGHFTFDSIIQTNAAPAMIADINDDGYGDVVTYYTSNNTYGVMLNDGDGNFSAGNSTYSLPGGPHDVGLLHIDEII